MNNLSKNILLKVGAIVKIDAKKSTLIPQRALSLMNKEKKEDLPTARKDAKAPVKFTRSAAYLDYKATDNFYGGDDRDLPNSHNLVISATGIFGFAYLIFLRDDIEQDGGANLLKPVYESVPELAIPLLQATIIENKRQGMNTKKLEMKLAEYMKDPEKYGAKKPKLVEN